jgi:mono/diheme cytochrome c family protein
MRLLICVFVGSFPVWGADSFTADSARGGDVFRTESCIQCHSVNGKGGKLAPDLGRRTGRGYSPVQMASLMWNHAPAMWSAMRKQGVVKSSLTEERAADLFAFLYSAKYFDTPGDAGRGKRAFAANSCGVCHAESGSGVGPAVAQWSSLTDPVLLVHSMWNHAAGMRKELEARKIAWPQLTSQELVDILVYLQNLPAVRGKTASFELPPATGGAQLFQSKSCSNCHAGKLALEGRLRATTLTDVAVAMWNHAPLMDRTPIELTAEQMRSIVSYVWGRQFFLNTGDPDRGKRVFETKRCASCHSDASSGAPNLAQTREGGSAVSMIAVLWEHGPRMLESMNQKNVAWPRFTSREMSDLIAYLGSTR